MLQLSERSRLRRYSHFRQRRSTPGHRSTRNVRVVSAIMALGTRPALARVRVNGANTTQLGKRQSSSTRGSTNVGIEVPHHLKSRLAFLVLAGPPRSNAPHVSRLSKICRGYRLTLHAR